MKKTKKYMSKWEILQMLHEFSQLEIVGSYFELMLTVINRHPHFLDDIAAKHPRNVVELWKICKEGV